MRLAVSACLLGCPCRYDHKSCYSSCAAALAKEHELIPVCPEQTAGLPSPRKPVELCEGRVLTREGEDLSAVFEEGLDTAMQAVEGLQCEAAVLQQRSPSCGCGKIYDGSFASRLIEGDGLFTRRLKEKGIPVFSIEELEANPDCLNSRNRKQNTK